MKRGWLLMCAAVGSLTGILTAGCGSGPNVTVTIASPTSAQTIISGQTVIVTASAVSDGATVTNVTWSLAGSGCSGSACGTLTNETGTSVTYQAPSLVTAITTVYVIATSTTSPSKSASISITLLPVSVQIPDKVSQLAANSSRYSWTQFTAAVQNDPKSQGVTWSLTANGTSCSPACGTLSLIVGNDMQYRPPATVPAAPNNTPTLTATSMTDPTKSDSDTFTIFDGASACGTGGNESELNGQYAIMLQGWMATGSTAGPMLYAASFGADGTGKITEGQDQFNPYTNYASTANLVPSSSSYSVGTDGRGCLTLTDDFYDSTFTLQFSLGAVSGGIASKGDIILFNKESPTPERAAGILRRQDPSAFSLSALASNYVTGVDGWEKSGAALTHYSLAGSFAQSGGTLSNSWLDANDGGSLQSSGLSGSIQPIASLDGTAMATLQLPSFQEAKAVIYVINASELFVVSFELPPDGPLFAGRAIATSGSLTPASIAPSYIFRSAGNSAGVASASIGILKFSGGGVSGMVSGKLQSYAVGAAGSQNVTGT